MMMRGVRGAITVEANTVEAIVEAAQALLEAIIAANEINEDDVASVIFTSTPDLTAAYPAKAARLVGWTQAALMGCQEVDVPGGMPRVIRILVHWNTPKRLNEIKHIYLREAVKLRPDLNKTTLNGSHQ